MFLEVATRFHPTYRSVHEMKEIYCTKVLPGSIVFIFLTFVESEFSSITAQAHQRRTSRSIKFLNLQQQYKCCHFYFKTLNLEFILRHAYYLVSRPNNQNANQNDDSHAGESDT